MSFFFAPGVVFNEMKGVYSQPDNILGRTAQQASSPFLDCLLLLFLNIVIIIFNRGNFVERVDY